MKKSQHRSKQLQLRLLVDVGGVSSNLAAPVTPKVVSAPVGKSSAKASPASENDMSVYRTISGNYFRSLQKI